MKSISAFFAAAALYVGSSATAFAAACLSTDPNCVNVVPEPGSLALVGIAVAGLAWVARKHKK